MVINGGDFSYPTGRKFGFYGENSMMDFLYGKGKQTYYGGA